MLACYFYRDDDNMGGTEFLFHANAFEFIFVSHFSCNRIHFLCMSCCEVRRWHWQALTNKGILRYYGRGDGFLV